MQAYHRIIELTYPKSDTFSPNNAFNIMYMHKIFIRTQPEFRSRISETACKEARTDIETQHIVSATGKDMKYSKIYSLMLCMYVPR